MEIAKLEALITHNEHSRMIRRIQKVEINDGKPHGTAYLSSIVKMTVHAITNAGEETTMGLVIKKKLTSQHPLLQKFYDQLFSIEIKVYNEVFPSMEHIMIDGNLGCDTLWPAFIGSEGNRTIITEDLTSQGYQQVNGFFDFEDARAVISHLAKFHAVSHIHLKKGKINDLPQEDVARGNKMLNVKGNANIKYIAQALIKNWDSTWHALGRHLEGLSIDDYIDKLSELRSEEGLMVINHGDLRQDNVFFKRQGSLNKVKDVKFIDFQIINANSNLIDLHHFFYLTIQVQVAVNHFDELLHEYTWSLQKTFKDLHYEPEFPITFETLQRELNRTKVFGVYLVLCRLYITMRGCDETPDIGDFTEKEFYHKIKFFSSEKPKERLEFMLGPYKEKGRLE